ncbi:hypothetical protein N7539_005422 [Penicillium diatomitis]|uniref:Uncharacterized protein n=1 Tax=Penicillium diatomitis TaxID=2819901 RepID=A0A9W9X7B6_9EURO|nr:uncharacterized protein N7539_005422 [Penicillium diatomitis]KAJ5485434.1 hypothetical protein N7539_005422 [Penicillium diatomitis]
MSKDHSSLHGIAWEERQIGCQHNQHVQSTRALAGKLHGLGDTRRPWEAECQEMRALAFRLKGLGEEHHQPPITPSQ